MGEISVHFPHVEAALCSYFVPPRAFGPRPECVWNNQTRVAFPRRRLKLMAGTPRAARMIFGLSILCSIQLLSRLFSARFFGTVGVRK